MAASSSFKSEVRSKIYGQLCKANNAMDIAKHLVNECGAFIDYCADNFGEEHKEAHRCAIGILAKWDSQSNPDRYKDYSMSSMFDAHLCAGRIIENEDNVAISQLEDEIISKLGK